MLLVRVFRLHILWFITFSVVTLFRGLACLYVLFSNSAVYLMFNLFSTSFMDLKVRFIFDYISLSFMTTVLLITTIIMVYSFNYMSPYSKPAYFLWITVLFVRSMLLVITMPNLMFAMLGWDGLGLVSFFLIVYYQNQSSIVSGLFTLLINRIGDRFFLGRLMLMFYMFPDFSFFRSNLVPTFLAVLLVLTFMTKRALYPFSPWLPIAIAAPTPISALVHSSTLVTAGLYLIMRFSYILYGCPDVLNLLFIIRLFTSFYAGLNTVFEVDFKKLIALSTLRHLGFISIAFSLGLLHLSFFHLLVHALFKSLLFMTMGDIIINLNHSQDARYLSSGFVYTPFSCFIMSVSLVNLLGLPRLRGFFSKDLVLETIRFSNVSFFLELVLYFNVIFTYYYTYKLFFYSFRPNKLNPYQTFHSVSLIHVVLICFLGLSTLVFSSFFMRSIFSFVVFYPLALSVKFTPLILNSLIFAYLVVFLVLPTLKSKLVASYCSSMLFLSNLAITFSSNLYYRALFSSVKSTEIGFVNYSLNSQITKPLSVLTSSLFLSLYKVQHTSFYLILFLVPIVLLSFIFYAG